jgi:prepilin-type N-terminal cleavage/methylation domain-containing protein
MLPHVHHERYCETVMTGREIQGIATAQRREATAVFRTRPENGFTLIEMVITTAIIPIVIGALVLGLLAVLSLQNKTSAKVSDTSDAQLVSTYFEADVQSAVYLTTSASPTNTSSTTTVTANPMAKCGTGTQLLGLEWDFNPNINPGTGQYQDVVTYAEVTFGSRTSLIREYCAGASSTPTFTATIASDLSTSQAAPTISTSSSYSGTPSTAWASAVGVTSITFSITEPASSYSYSLLAVPRASTSSGQVSSISTPAQSCGFATIGTGTYASSLCFADFSAFNPSKYDGSNTSGETTPQSPAPSSCQQMEDGIAGTDFTLSFCLSTTSSVGEVLPWAIPTYPTTTCPSTSSSESYLGNNGFYTGIPGDPALYEDCVTSSPNYANGALAFVYFTNIKLLDQNGNQVSNWDLVTGDAETTDGGEYMIWTSNQDLNVLNNSTTSTYGNACSTTSGSGVTGLGSTTVECKPNETLDRTGTLMLEAAAPTSLTVTMKGNGLEAVFLGVLLPS